MFSASWINFVKNLKMFAKIWNHKMEFCFVFEHVFCNPIVKNMCSYTTIHINESSIVFWYIVQ